jgi:DNA-directed RNA polymerase specialized sigma24 family protein
MPVPSQHSVTDIAMDDALLDDATLAGAVRDAVEVLPSRLRLVLYLTDVEGLSCGQAAKVMGTSAYTVAGELHRARRWLRARLGPVIRQALEDKPASLRTGQAPLRGQYRWS